MRFNRAITDIVPYKPGRPIEHVMREYGLAEVVKLASNEAPWPPFVEVQEAVAAALPDLNRYPDGDALVLREALAERYERPLEEIIVGAGSCELLILLGDALLEAGDEVVFADPSFAVYTDVCLRREARAVPVPLRPDLSHDLDAMAAAIGPATKMVIVCNPNNPTGTYRAAADIAAFVDAVPEDVLVVLDEAYNECVTADDWQDTRRLQAERPNVCILRTFSKIYGLAGLRVGYGLCPVPLKDALDKVRQPFNVSHLAQVAACEALRHMDQVLDRRRLNAELREYLQEQLTAMGRAWVPSEANFLLVAIEDLCHPQDQVCVALQSLGAIVRDGNFLGCPGWARVTVGSREEIDFFVARLRSLRVEGR